MRKNILIISFILFSTFEVFACSCGYAWNDSFSRTAKYSEFVALVKIISFDDYLEKDIMDYDGKMPYSMTAEIIKKYKGTESRKRIKIWGDDGMRCRPYLDEFKINNYYLIAPIPLYNSLYADYDFFTCRTDYLSVNLTMNIAYGKYSFITRLIDLETFEIKLKHGDLDLIILVSIIGLLTIGVIIVRRKNKRNANIV